MSPLKEAKEYGREAVVNLFAAGKHLGIAGIGFIKPFAEASFNKACAMVEKAVDSGKPEVAKAIAAAADSAGKLAVSLKQMSEEMLSKEEAPIEEKTINGLKGEDDE